MSEIYSDDNGHRVVVRHRGPAGKGIPEGGTAGQVLVKSSTTSFDTQWAAAPSGTDGITKVGTTINNRIAVFEGTGNTVKDGGVLVADLATVAQLNTKVSIVPGSGLSETNFTPAEKAKLASLKDRFRGIYTSLATINATSPTAGDFCVVTSVGANAELAFYDSVNSKWALPGIGESDGPAIAAILYKAGEMWAQGTSRVFTTVDKDLLVAHEALITSLGLTGTGSGKAYGSLSFYSQSAPYVLASATNTDGLNNMIPVNVTTTLGEVANFVANGNGALKHTAGTAKMFNVAASVTFSRPDVEVQFVFAFAKNGNVLPDTRQLVSAGPRAANVALTANVSLGLDAVITVVVGTYVTGYSPTIHSLALTIAEA